MDFMDMAIVAVAPTMVAGTETRWGVQRHDVARCSTRHGCLFFSSREMDTLFSQAMAGEKDGKSIKHQVMHDRVITGFGASSLRRMFKIPGIERMSLLKLLTTRSLQLHWFGSRKFTPGSEH